MKYKTAQTSPLQETRPPVRSAPSAELIEHEQTFSGDIFVPLLQNLIGGGAVAGLSAILSVSVSRWMGVPFSSESTALACLLFGGAVTCLVTIVRFFGDDIGLVRFAYRRGQESMRLRVSALELELAAARKELSQVLGKTKAVPSSPALQQLERAHAAAEHLIHWYFEDLPIDRRSCESRNMAQSDWRRARHLLLAAGVMDEQGMCVRTLPEALTQVHAHHRKLAAVGGQRENFVTPV